jgi:hypothetical protein
LVPKRVEVTYHDSELFLALPVEDLPRVQLRDAQKVDNLVPNLGIHETEEVSLQFY